jgi:hypothetical protein
VQAEELTLLQQRVQAVESVLQYIDARSHDAHSDLTFDEYQVMLLLLLLATPLVGLLAMHGVAVPTTGLRAAHHSLVPSWPTSWLLSS